MSVSSNLSLLDVSNSIRELTMEETRDLVFQMGVPWNILKDIAAMYDGENRKQNFVKKWIDMNADASWDQLVMGLRKIDQNKLAAEIECLHVRTTLVHYDPLSVDASLSIVNHVVSSDARVERVKRNIEHLEEEFTDIKSEARQSLTKREVQESRFVEKFRDHLFDLPVSKKQVHIRFFSRNEDEILKAETIQKLFIILGRYCNYSNYEIIFHVVKRFCHELSGRIGKYRDSLTIFEKSTTVDVFLCAISAHPYGEVRERFIRMTIKINKPPSECTLYEIRELKESVEENASLESYAMYIDSPDEGSVHMLLHIHGDVAWMVGVVLTLDVRQKYLISDVTIRRFMGRSCSLIEYLSDELYSASEKGEVEAVRSLITAGADVNVKMWEGSALGRSEVVLLLLKAGARINFQNQRGHSALMRAACNGYSVVVSLLLKEGANTDLLTDDGDSALMMASSKGDNDVVSLLLGAGANIDPQNKMGESSLMIATKNGKTEIVSKLVKARAALDLKTNGGDSAVIFATAYCYLPVLKELVRAGADLNLCNQEGLTALMISSRSGTTDLTETLLTGKGISLDVQTDNGWSALFFAVDKGDVAPAELLLRAGADPHLKDTNGLTVLDVAIACGHRAVYQLLRKHILFQTPDIIPVELVQTPKVMLQRQEVKHLVKKSKEKAREALNRFDPKWPELITAIAMGRTKAVSPLLQTVINIDRQNENGESALIMAVRKNNTKVVSLLVKAAGASLDIQDKYGYSALMWAKNEEIISLLLQAGANTDLQNKVKGGPRQHKSN
jgi:ankyrin repeat protein